ncbi:response regulator transcription factor [bacterium]|nr:response regulator transcription factor [bacterium]
MNGKSKNLIFVLDDEQDIVELVSVNLEKSGFTAKGFTEVKKFYSFLKEKKPDLILLDLMLPGEDGFEICKFLKKQDEYRNIPIIMLTAKSDETDKILGLELGADDYVTKPFSPRELIARVKAVLRRNIAKSEEKSIKVCEDLTMDLNKFEVLYKGQKIDLTTTEFNILKLLASKKGWVFSRDQILNNLWGDEKYVIDRTIDVHIKHLRTKLGEAGKYIKNVRGMGYKLEESR